MRTIFNLYYDSETYRIISDETSMNSVPIDFLNKSFLNKTSFVFNSFENKKIVSKIHLTILDKKSNVTYLIRDYVSLYDIYYCKLNKKQILEIFTFLSEQEKSLLSNDKNYIICSLDDIESIILEKEDESINKFPIWKDKKSLKEFINDHIIDAAITKAKKECNIPALDQNGNSLIKSQIDIFSDLIEKKLINPATDFPALVKSGLNPDVVRGYEELQAKKTLVEVSDLKAESRQIVTHKPDLEKQTKEFLHKMFKEDANKFNNLEEEEYYKKYTKEFTSKPITGFSPESIKEMIPDKIDYLNKEQVESKTKKIEKKSIIGDAAFSFAAKKTNKTIAEFVAPLVEKALRSVSDTDSAIMAGEIVKSDLGQGLLGYPASLIIPKLLPLSDDNKEKLKHDMQVDATEKIAENILGPLGEWLMSELKQTSLIEKKRIKPFWEPNQEDEVDQIFDNKKELLK